MANEHPKHTRRFLRREPLPRVSGSLFGYLRDADIATMEVDPHEHVEETVKNRRATRRLLYLLILLAFVLGAALGIFAQRVEVNDHRNSKSNDFSHATACLILGGTPDKKKYHDYLQAIRSDYPDCPTYTPPPSPSPSVSVRTRVLPGRTTTRDVPMPGPTVTQGAPPPSVRIVVRPGPTVTRTRTKTVRPTCPLAVDGKCVTLPVGAVAPQASNNPRG